MISEAKIYCFSHFMCFYAIIFTYILLIQDAARQCQRCENVVFPLCRCARLSLYFINTGCGSAVSFLHFRAVACAFLSRPPVETQNLASPDWHGIPSLSGVCTCIPQPSSSRDARSCVSCSAFHSFFVRSLHVHSQPHARETQDSASLILFDGVYC